jgi:type I restriction enzyme, S subunit
LSKQPITHVALSEVADVRFSSVDKHTVADETPVRLCNYTDVFKNRFIANSMDFMTASATDSEIERFGLRHGDIAITKDSETPEEIGIPALVERPSSDLVLGYHLALIRAKADRCDPYFLAAALHSRHVARHYLRTAVGLTRFGLSIKSVANTPVPNLPLSAQQKIGRWYRESARLESQTDALIAAKREQKRGMMQQLLTGKVRFPGFTDPWKTVRLGNIAARVTRRNRGASSRVLTASGQFGLIDQREFFSRRVASAKIDEYYLLRRSEFAYNRSSMQGYDFGAIKRLDRYEEAAISTLYICFAITDKHVDSDFLAQVFDSRTLDRQLRTVVRIGIRDHGLLNLDIGDFFEMSIRLPGQKEQQRIAECLSAADREIRLLEDSRRCLANERRGLMERLLSGDISIPSSDTSAA